MGAGAWEGVPRGDALVNIVFWIISMLSFPARVPRRDATASLPAAVLGLVSEPSPPYACGARTILRPPCIASRFRKALGS